MKTKTKAKTTRKLRDHVCIDCGRSFKSVALKWNIRCPKCSAEHKRAMNNQKNRSYYARKTRGAKNNICPVCGAKCKAEYCRRCYDFGLDRLHEWNGYTMAKEDAPKKRKAYSVESLETRDHWRGQKRCGNANTMWRTPKISVG